MTLTATDRFVTVRMSASCRLKYVVLQTVDTLTTDRLGLSEMIIFHQGLFQIHQFVRILRATEQQNGVEARADLYSEGKQTPHVFRGRPQLGAGEAASHSISGLLLCGLQSACCR